MIAYIKGALLECREKSCVILTAGGVGYELALPAHTFSRLPARGVDVAVHETGGDELAIEVDDLSIVPHESVDA